MKTPIPASIVAKLRSFSSGGLLDVLWKALVVTLLALVVYALASLSVFGPIIAGIFVATLLNDDVRELVSDLWHRDFYEL